jgi:signal transduction histidine kinase
MTSLRRTLLAGRRRVLGANSELPLRASPEAGRASYCHYGAVDTRARPAYPVVISSAVFVASTVSAVVAIVGDSRLRAVARPDLATPLTTTALIVPAVTASLIVGIAIVIRRRHHPVGWLFLGLGGIMAASGPIDFYVKYGAIARPGSLPGAAALCGVDDGAIILWLVLLGLALQLTPTGRSLSPRWARLTQVTVAAGVLGAISAIFNPGPFDPPLQDVVNPLAVGVLGDIAHWTRFPVVLVAGLGLIASGISVAVRYHRAQGVERKQLQWMCLVGVPLVLFVPVAFLSAWTNHPAPLLLATGGFIVLIPVGAGLAITQYHLYDVDRILSRALSYAISTAVIALAYVSVVVMAGRASAGLAKSSTLSAVLGTLAAVTLFSPARRAIQDGLDRRFNRRRFDAVRMVRRHVDDPAPAAGIEDVMRQALDDPSLRVSYWVDERRQWVSADGRSARPTHDALETSRHGQPVACVEFDAEKVGRDLVEVVTVAAMPELDNARLRAAISLQLVEVNESRARIAAAQVTERRKLERNLHDGAQQRLLALAFELQAALVNGDPRRLREAATAGVEQARSAVLELRELANGLHPAVLSDGGLAGALEELVERTPVPLDVHVADGRYRPDVEVAAWFIICEAVTNAQKHSDATRVVVRVEDGDGWLTVTVSDDGCGGADAAGSGLQGIRDRAEAAGGDLHVSSSPESGTTVRGRLPCEP